MRIFRNYAVIGTIALASCAGRTPQPVAVVQPQDRFIDCTAIAAEVQANNAKIQELGGEQSEKVAQNVAAGVAGLFIWPLWFGMDFQGAAGTEATALQSRQQYLGILAGQKNCGGTGPGVARYPLPSAGAPGSPSDGAAPLSAPAGAAVAPSPTAAQTSMASPQPTMSPAALPPGHLVSSPITGNHEYYPTSTFVDVQ